MYKTWNEKKEALTESEFVMVGGENKKDKHDKSWFLFSFLHKLM